MRTTVAGKPLVLIPSPRSAQFTGRVFDGVVPGDEFSQVILPRTLGNGAVPVESIRDASLPQGAYTASVTAAAVTVKSGDPEGLRNAVVTVSDTVRQLGGLAECDIADEPAFKTRAILEGYCGKPWPREGRFQMLDFALWRKFNRYFSSTRAPKVSFSWREPFDSDELDVVGEVAERCRQYGIDYVFSIRPADISVSDDADRMRLFSKLQTVSRLGIRHFILLEDDVKTQLSDGDGAAFGDYGTAHSRLVVETYRFLKSYDPQSRLIFCPSPYTTDSLSTPAMGLYVEKVREIVPAEIEVIWTGPFCCSAKIDDYDADHYGAFVGRKPFLWDNYPVIDGRPGLLFLGPLKRRSPALADHVSGYGTNAMDWPVANFIPMSTIAEYLWNPQDYDPDVALEDAIRFELGEAALPAAKRIVELFTSDWQEPEIEQGAGGSAEVYINNRGNASTAEQLKRVADELPRLVEKLNALTPNRDFVAMLGPVVANLVELSKVVSLDTEAVKRRDRGDERGAEFIENRLRRELVRMEVGLRYEHMAAISYLRGDWRYYRKLTGDTSTSI